MYSAYDQNAPWWKPGLVGAGIGAGVGAGAGVLAAPKFAPILEQLKGNL